MPQKVTKKLLNHTFSQKMSPQFFLYPKFRHGVGSHCTQVYSIDQVKGGEGLTLFELGELPLRCGQCALKCN